MKNEIRIYLDVVQGQNHYWTTFIRLSDDNVLHSSPTSSAVEAPFTLHTSNLELLERYVSQYAPIRRMWERE